MQLAGEELPLLQLARQLGHLIAWLARMGAHSGQLFWSKGKLIDFRAGLCGPPTRETHRITIRAAPLCGWAQMARQDARRAAELLATVCGRPPNKADNNLKTDA